MTKAPETNSRTAEEAQNHVVAEGVISEFVGNLKLREIRVVSERLVLMSEICQGLLAGELESDHIDVLRAMGRRLGSDGSTELSDAIVAAIEQGEQGFQALVETINRALHITASYTSADSSEAELAEIIPLRVTVLEERQKRRSEKKERPGAKGKDLAPAVVVRYGVMRLPFLRTGAIHQFEFIAIQGYRVALGEASLTPKPPKTGQRDATGSAFEYARRWQHQAYGQHTRSTAPRARAGSSILPDTVPPARGAFSFSLPAAGCPDLHTYQGMTMSRGVMVPTNLVCPMRGRRSERLDVRRVWGMPRAPGRDRGGLGSQAWARGPLRRY